MANLSLYHIQTEYKQLAEQIIESGGEVDEQVENALKINAEQLQEKAVQFALMIKDYENDISAIDKEMERLQGLKSSREKAQKRLKDIISNAMLLYEVSEIKGENFKLSFRESSSVKIEDESLVPMFFKEKQPVTYKIPLAEIKKAITGGESVPGAVLVKSKNLQIK